MLYLFVSAIKSVIREVKRLSLSSVILDKWIIIIFLQFLALNGFSEKNDFFIVDNEPFWFVYQRFNGYHANFADFESEFLREINKQSLSSQVVDKPFNVYFSETDWAIGCRLIKKFDLDSPLKIQYYGSEKIVRTIFRGGDQNIPLFLEVATSYIKEKNYYWDGCLLLEQLSDDPGKPACKLTIPVSRDYYKLFIKPYGIVRIVITFLCLLFAVFLLSYKKGSILSNRILGVFMLIYALINCNDFIWIFNIYKHYPHLYNFAISFQFLLPPLMLLYTLSVVKEHFRINEIHLLHLLPFMVAAVVYFFIYQVHDAESKLRLLNNGFRESPFFDWVYPSESINQLCYLLVSVFVVFYYPLKNKHLHFKPEKHLLHTLKFLLIGILCITAVELVKNEIHMQKSLHYIFKAIEILVYLAMISTLIVRGLLYPEMFFNKTGNGNGSKYNRSPLTWEHKIHYLQKIKSYMEKVQPYLSSSVNLTEFAKEIFIPSRYISQILNEELGMSFYDFMNKYRIDKAGELLMNPDYNNNSIIDIAWECGFNSKSVFNAAFKKFTGMTPSEFRMERQHAIL